MPSYSEFYETFVIIEPIVQRQSSRIGCKDMDYHETCGRSQDIPGYIFSNACRGKKRTKDIAFLCKIHSFLRRNDPLEVTFTDETQIHHLDIAWHAGYIFASAADPSAY